jgi:hypothetical protein
VGIKNAKNRAKTTKICLIEGAGTNLQRTLKNLDFNVIKGPNGKKSNTMEGYFCEFRKTQGGFCKNERACRFDRY